MLFKCGILYVLINARALSKAAWKYSKAGCKVLSYQPGLKLNFNLSGYFSFFNVCWTFQVPEVNFWVIPIIQGFVQVEELVVNYNETSDEERSSPDTPPKEITCVDDIHPRFTVALISRRSRHRAGRVCLRGVMLWFSPVAWAATSN